MRLETILFPVMAVLMLVRMSRRRAFRVGRLWIMPAAMVVVVGFGLSRLDCSPAVLTGLFTGLLAGVVLGIMRAKMSIDRIDVLARTIRIKPSIWFVLLFGAVFGLKAFVRIGLDSSFQGATAFILCLTAGTMCGQRWRFYQAFARASAAETIT